MVVISCPTDSTFGPAVSDCRGGFDFTIEFEDIVLSLVPSSLFILLSVARLWYLYTANSVSKSSRLGIAKLVESGPSSSSL
jgi:ATP-binding cassette subfamily C (CFTR/MRP) protein 1